MAHEKIWPSEQYGGHIPDATTPHLLPAARPGPLPRFVTDFLFVNRHDFLPATMRRQLSDCIRGFLSGSIRKLPSGTMRRLLSGTIRMLQSGTMHRLLSETMHKLLIGTLRRPPFAIIFDFAFAFFTLDRVFF